MDSPGADKEGWVREGMLRKRQWKRFRERDVSAMVLKKDGSVMGYDMNSKGIPARVLDSSVMGYNMKSGGIPATVLDGSVMGYEMNSGGIPATVLKKDSSVMGYDMNSGRGESFSRNSTGSTRTGVSATMGNSNSSIGTVVMGNSLRSMGNSIADSSNGSAATTVGSSSKSMGSSTSMGSSSKLVGNSTSMGISSKSMGSSTSMGNPSTGSAVQPKTLSSVGFSSQSQLAAAKITGVGAATAALQRLELGIQNLSLAEDWTRLDVVEKECKSAILEARQTLEAVGIDDKPTVRAARIKLANELLRDEKKFDVAIKEAARRVKSGVVYGNSSSFKTASSFDVTATTSEMDLGSNQRRQQLMQMETQHRQTLGHEIDANTQLIEHRKKELMEINRVANTVNDMMNDLAGMVNTQGDDLKLASKNVKTARENTDRGLVEVKKAEEYQTEGQGCVVC